MSSRSSIHLDAPLKLKTATVQLPGSKSIANRMLILRELTGSPMGILNLPDADDVQLLNRHLMNPAPVCDCGAGGTTFRFLLALRVLQGRAVTFTGSARLKQRPVATLVDALRQMGALIKYDEKEGFPPLTITPAKIKGGQINLDATVSSQFVSALMMIAPYVSGGLQIHLRGPLVSAPYVRMTAALMDYMKVQVAMEGNVISISEGKYFARDFTVPADWSAASYFYGLVACFPGSELTFPGLINDGWQGDRALAEMMVSLGVATVFGGSETHIINVAAAVKELEFNLSEHPDLAQTIAVIAAVKGVAVSMTGLSTLINKETNRLVALKTELEKTGVVVQITDHSLAVSGVVDRNKIAAAVFETYEDHRMAMALSILVASGATVTINNPAVVTKSFPTFWEELRKIGIATK